MEAFLLKILDKTGAKWKSLAGLLMMLAGWGIGQWMPDQATLGSYLWSTGGVVLGVGVGHKVLKATNQ